MSEVPLLMSLITGVTCPAPTFIVMFCTIIEGLVLSTTKALFAASDPVAPGLTNVSTLAFPATSFIVPPLSPNELVAA